MFHQTSKLSLVVLSLFLFSAQSISNEDFFRGRTFPLKSSFEKRLANDYGLGNEMDQLNINPDISIVGRNFGIKRYITTTNIDDSFGSPKGIKTEQRQECYCPCATSMRYAPVENNIKLLQSPALQSPAQSLRARLPTIRFTPRNINKVFHITHDPNLVPQSNLVQPTFCDFTKTSCNWMNDVHISSRFKYGYENYFKNKMWYIDTSDDVDRGTPFPIVEQKHIADDESFELDRRGTNVAQSMVGWGRLVSPYYRNDGNESDGCLLVQFEFVSEGRDTLTIIIQDSLNSRSILDYKHDRNNNVEESVLKKYVPFHVFGNPRFFLQFDYRTTFTDNHYGFKYFHFIYGSCAAFNTENQKKESYGAKY